MEGKVLDTLLSVVIGIVRLEGHAIVTHGVSAMLAEAGVARTRDLSISLPVVGVDGVFSDEFPRTLGTSRCSGCGGSGSTIRNSAIRGRNASCRGRLVGNKNEVTMPIN
jgi:hypothetical protein